MIANPGWPWRMRVALLLMAALALGGCLSRDAKRLVQLGETASDSRPRTLAYEHTVAIDVPETEVRAVHDQTLASCNKQPQGACTVLSSDVSTGEEVFATLRMRATPVVVRTIIATLDQKGELVSVSTQATDLAKPIADAERSAAMLASYRAKLEQLANQSGNDADTLIKVHRELAEVQSKIEATAGEREQLRKQVELEILNVSISSERHMPFSKPIERAFRDFGSNLAYGIGGTVTGFAVLLPGVLVLAFMVAGWRRWRRSRRAAATPG